MPEKFFQKGNPIIEIISTLGCWVKDQMECIQAKVRKIGLSSLAQWCIILVMLYLTLAG